MTHPCWVKRWRTGNHHGALNALAGVMSDRRRTVLPEHEQVLAEQAEALSIRDFAVLVRRWAAIADDYLAGDTHDEHQPRNRLYASVTMDGWVDINGRLEPVAGAELLTTPGLIWHLPTRKMPPTG